MSSSCHTTLVTCSSYDMTLVFLYLQGGVISRAEIDKVHSDLIQSVEEFLLELMSRQEQQRIEEEEAAKLKKYRQEQVGLMTLHWEEREH